MAYRMSSNMRICWLWNLCFVLFVSAVSSDVIQLSSSPPANASKPIPKAFVSYSIEFAFFPDFAGNLSSPNGFSNNLLNNLGNLQGTKPIIRVGGNTQDYALLDANLTVATKGIYTNVSTDYPRILTYGPSYFQSYATWPNTTFIHGFNMGKNGTVALKSLLATVQLACRALRNGKLAYWELGNEPDLFKTSAQGIVRPSTWNEQAYVDEWLNKTRLMNATLKMTCPELPFDLIAPSFAGTNNSLKPITTWSDGLNRDKDIKQISSHNYINGATAPGVTLRGTLLNHTNTVASISKQVTLMNALEPYGLPFILGETNSLYNEGAPGLSNAFGAALWGVDFNLYSASQGIRRVHMHQGTDYRYASWQPITTNKTTIGTKPPYYGNIAVAATLGNLNKRNVSVYNIPLTSSEFESAYAVYRNGNLSRIAILNMIEYNYTEGASVARPMSNYTFKLPPGYANITRVTRLIANGSNSISGITFGGYSFNYELNRGKPVLLSNATRNETAPTSNGLFTVKLPYSSFALISVKPL